MLTRVLDAHCEAFGIHGEEARQLVAAALLAYYRTGVTDERELAALLARKDEPHGPS